MEAVSAHIDECSSCKAELARIHEIMSLVEDSHEEMEPPVGLWHGVHGMITSPARPGLLERVAHSFFPPRRAIAFAAGLAAVAGAILLQMPHEAPQRPASMAMIQYVQDHAAASSGDVFSDRVNLGFVSSTGAKVGNRQQ
jgi:hypothetical protein